MAAATTPNKSAKSKTFAGVKGEKEEVGNIITELSDKRTETSKEFLLDNGTKLVAEYITTQKNRKKKRQKLLKQKYLPKQFLLQKYRLMTALFLMIHMVMKYNRHRVIL